VDDILPAIGIAIREPPFTVLGRLHALASTQALHVSFKPWRLGHTPGRILEVAPAVALDHRGLLAQLIADTSEVERLRVGILADKWKPDPPTYASYVRAAKEVLQPLLRAYQKRHGQLYRLGIPLRRSLKRRLPTGARTVLGSFTSLANKTTLHPLDWQRFYSFIYYCHVHRVSCGCDDLRQLLVGAGFREEKADHLANIYYHGRGLLKPEWPGHRAWWPHR